MQSQSCVTIAEMAAASPAAVRVFERLGIDYCCSGKRSLAEVCLEKGLDANVVQREVDAAAGARKGVDRDWVTAPLRDLADYIVDTHHEYLKRKFQPLGERLESVYRVYNERYGTTLTGDVKRRVTGNDHAIRASRSDL
jgi:regulator of cell morphogenesis and NO signaling